ncbi:hypothetical protein WN943_024473 [Citrus x changshan-huyou]
MEVKLDQHSGYVTVDAKAGRALFYYFVESANSSTEPLVLWLNGVTKHHEFLLSLALLYNCIISTSRAWRSRDRFESIAMENVYPINLQQELDFPTRIRHLIMMRTAEDSYTFLVNWFERFPEYKAREFFLAGESYAGLPVSIRLEYIHPFLLEYTSSAEFTSCKMLPAFHGSISVSDMLKDSPSTVLPIIQELMRCGIRVYICRPVALNIEFPFLYTYAVEIQMTECQQDQQGTP